MNILLYMYWSFILGYAYKNRYSLLLFINSLYTSFKKYINGDIKKSIEIGQTKDLGDWGNIKYSFSETMSEMICNDGKLISPPRGSYTIMFGGLTLLEFL